MAITRSGRTLLYPAQVLLNTDELRAQFFKMVDVSNLAQAILGVGLTPGDLVSGLNCIPTGSNLKVQIGQGVLWHYTDADATAYPADNSGLAADTVDNLYKPFTAIGVPPAVDTSWTAGTGGVNYATSPTLPAAATAANSIAYLIQAIATTADTESVSRQYYNPSNPSVPITDSAPDVRVDYPFLSVKASVQAPSPVVPTPDAGHVGLWVVTVPNGTTVINSGMITPYANAPFIGDTLTQKLGVKQLQNSTPIYSADSGVANAYVVTGTPAYGTPQDGTVVWFKAANSNNGASTLDNGAGAAALQVETLLGLSACVGGEIVLGTQYQAMRNGSIWQLMNPSTKPTYSYSVSQKTAGQSIPATNVAVDVEWDTVDFADAYGVITYVGSPSFEFTVHAAGRYKITGSLGFNFAANDGKSVYGQIYVNSVNVQRLSQANITADDVVVNASIELVLAANDVVQLAALNATNTALSLLTLSEDAVANRFQIQYLGQ